MTAHIEALLGKLDREQPIIAERDRRYRGHQPLRFATADVEGDFKNFGVNIYRTAVNAVAERMKVKKIRADVDGVDVSDNVAAWWDWAGMDMKLQSIIADVLAVGSAYLIVWQKNGRPFITVESAEQVTTMLDPISGEVVEAVKRWYEVDAQGVVVSENVVYYGMDDIVFYVRGGNGLLVEQYRVDNPIGAVPVVPLINVERVGDRFGHSVIDDLSDLVDALSKVLSDMLIASEVVARPKRFATGVSLDEVVDDGFSADGDPVEPVVQTTVEAPFANGSDMFVTEQVDAKFGQLPGADLVGYKTAVELITQQIMTVSALPAHMIGVTTANPASSDAIRAAEASLTARAESRALVLGLALENALKLVVVLLEDAYLDDIGTWVEWRDFATKSQAQEADAITKLHSLGIITTSEAREQLGSPGAS